MFGYLCKKIWDGLSKALGEIAVVATSLFIALVSILVLSFFMVLAVADYTVEKAAAIKRDYGKYARKKERKV